ncbi:hypothetical protein Tco_1082513 [Tanacetum coccineum]|uniref:Uncharacterized protein n=1 Tax=Tanacetum coccineum TaxID=301880 RepID=A0ABQ5I2P8_9ASTR
MWAEVVEGHLIGLKLVEVVDDVNSLNKEGGSLAAIENVNLDAGYDSGFEDGSSKEPNVNAEGLSDDFFAQYDQSDIHVNENIHDDNDGDVEVVQPTGSEADQQYMVNLRDDIATQITQARS